MATQTMKDCPTCGAATDAQWFCRNCGEYLPAPGTERTAAGLWRRFFALWIDSILIVLLLIVGWLIWFFFTAKEGQTPGKKLLGLRVIVLDGTVALVGTMWLREVVIKRILWAVIPLSIIAYIWALFDKDRQAVHDKMVKTYVIYHPGQVEQLQAVPLEAGAEYGGQASSPAEDADAAF